MAAKTFVPQAIRILRRFVNYYGKHRAKIATYVTAPELACLDAVVTAINACSAIVVINEAP